MRVKINRKKIAEKGQGSIGQSTYYNWLRRGGADASVLAEWCASTGTDLASVIVEDSGRVQRVRYAVRVAEELRRRKWSQAELARRCGVTRATVCLWVKKGGIVGARSARKLKEVLKLK